MILQRALITSVVLALLGCLVSAIHAGYDHLPRPLLKAAFSMIVPSAEP